MPTVARSGWRAYSRKPSRASSATVATREYTRPAQSEKLHELVPKRTPGGRRAADGKRRRRRDAAGVERAERVGDLVRDPRTGVSRDVQRRARVEGRYGRDRARRHLQDGALAVRQRRAVRAAARRSSRLDRG